MLDEQGFRNFFEFYKGQPQQVEAIGLLWHQLRQQAPELLDPKHFWIATYRQKIPEPSIHDPITNDWDGIKEAARRAGAVWPECVAAQWALESSWGRHTSGKNNFFGLKGDGTQTSTSEYIDGTWIQITDSFIDFPSITACVQYLIKHWYKNYKTYWGVNNAPNREEC